MTPGGDIRAAEGISAESDKPQSGSSYTIHLTVTTPTACASPDAGFQAPFPVVTLINGFQVSLNLENRHACNASGQPTTLLTSKHTQMPRHCTCTVRSRVLGLVCNQRRCGRPFIDPTPSAWHHGAMSLCSTMTRCSRLSRTHQRCLFKFQLGSSSLLSHMQIGCELSLRAVLLWVAGPVLRPDSGMASPAEQRIRQLAAGLYREAHISCCRPSVKALFPILRLSRSWALEGT